MTEATTNFFSLPEGENDRFVIIPEDYEQTRVVPIVICLIDHKGNPVHRGWIDAIPPIAEPLRRLARVVIRDVRRVSELAEGSVHALSAKFGAQLGKDPCKRIWVHAKWRARDLAAGGRRARTQREVALSDYQKSLLRAKGPDRFVKDVEDRDMVQRLFERMRELGYGEGVQMLEMYMMSDSRDQMDWSDPEIVKMFGVYSKRLRDMRSKQFSRLREKALELLRDWRHDQAA